MTETTIRPLREEDAPEWRRLWTAYLAFYETDVAPEVKDETFRRLLSDAHSEQRAQVAVRGGKLVGIVHTIDHVHNWHLVKVCYLQDLFTLPEARGTGVGRALIEAVYAEADRRGLASVYWLTQDFNHTARALYDRVGALTPFIKYTR